MTMPPATLTEDLLFEHEVAAEDAKSRGRIFAECNVDEYLALVAMARESLVLRELIRAWDEAYDLYYSATPLEGENRRRSIELSRRADELRNATKEKP